MHNARTSVFFWNVPNTMLWWADICSVASTTNISYYTVCKADYIAYLSNKQIHISIDFFSQPEAYSNFQIMHQCSLEFYRN